MGARDGSNGNGPLRLETRCVVRMKLRVENLPNGQVRARGKAWAATDAEPADWMIDKTDPIGNREGAPGLFINALRRVLDNFSLSKNQ